jgi:hypothetical protein
MTDAFLEIDTKFRTAFGAFKQIFAFRFGTPRLQRRVRFVENPTTGALELPVDLRLKLCEALRADARRLQRGLYFRLPSLYLRKFLLQTRYLSLRLRHYLFCKLLIFLNKPFPR